MAKRKNFSRDKAKTKKIVPSNNPSNGTAEIEGKESKPNYVFRIAGLLCMILGLMLLVNKIVTKTFYLRINDTKEITLSTIKKGILKSPLCNCPNHTIDNYGFLQFVKDISILNSKDTTTFTITSPSPNNLTTWPSHQFEADVYFLKKRPFGNYNTDSILNKKEYLKKGELLKKVHLKKLYFISLVNRLQLDVKFLSDNYISTFLPGGSSNTKLKRNSPKYSEHANSIQLDYKASYTNEESHDNAFLEFFGPKIAFLSKDPIELLGEKGPLIDLGSFDAQQKIYNNSEILVVIDVPYTARLSVADWGKEASTKWHTELFNEKLRPLGFKDGFFYNHIPLFLSDSTNNQYVYNFLNDPNAKYLPAIFPQPSYNFQVELKNPLNTTEFETLKAKCSKGDQIFQNQSFKNGVTFYKATAVQIQLPDSLSTSLENYLNKTGGSLSDAKVNYEILKDLREKYPAKHLYTQNDVTEDIIYYYPEIPETNGIYYFGNLDRVSCRNANIEYSFGSSGSKEVNDCSLDLEEVVLNNQNPFYTKIPILKSSAENDGMTINAKTKMYINNEREGETIRDHPIVQNLLTAFSFLGIGILAIVKPILAYLNALRAKVEIKENKKT
jgi:hypothetical protein